MAKKPVRKNPKLRLNKDSLQPVSEASLSQFSGGDRCTRPTTTPCPWPSTTNPGCAPPPGCGY